MSDDLVSEYLNFRFGNKFDKALIAKLLKFIQPALIASSQHSLLDDPSAQGQLASDPIIKLAPALSATNTMENLVRQTALKLQLVTNKQASCNFTRLNIDALTDNFERLNMLLTGIFVNAQHKQEALSHIKDLIADANFVKITDGYLCDESTWSQCKAVLTEILPITSIPITLVTDVTNDRRSELRAINTGWQVKNKNILPTTHDRYIETDKLKIMLSSGIFHLSTSSNTDLTYTVKIK